MSASLRPPSAAASVPQRLRVALTDLILERGYDRCTVGDVLARAQVSRSTFYAYYRDKDDLLLQGFDELGPPPPAEPGAALPDFAAWLFTATERHKLLATVLLTRQSRQVVCQHLENTLVVAVRSALRQVDGSAASATQLELQVRYFVGALMGLWQWWVDRDYPQPAAEMASTFHRLAQSGLDPISPPA